jgi:Ser/Thr protein kinase RdoA (MazF antagonist)
VKPPSTILAHWRIKTEVKTSPENGLLNDTFVVGSPPEGILQRVNPIFGPDVHLDIEAITAHLASKGIATPRLVRTSSGKLCVPTADGAWRLLSFVPGTTIHTISNPSQAESAAKIVGQFHRATEDLDHRFHFVRPGAHDTHKHMATLAEALHESSGHALEGPSTAIGTEVLSCWDTWDGECDLPLRISHGDLKISNVRFAADRRTALCLLDLDTLSHQSIAVEMGDAWRSWCNPAGEDKPDEARFDLSIFQASAGSWLTHGPALSPDERANLVAGVERISLELAARFCADSIRQTYFKEDKRRFPEPGTHNLQRAKGQLALARSVRSQRLSAEDFVRSR